MKKDETCQPCRNENHAEPHPAPKTTKKKKKPSSSSSTSDALQMQDIDVGIRVQLPMAGAVKAMHGLVDAPIQKEFPCETWTRGPSGPVKCEKEATKVCNVCQQGMCDDHEETKDSFVCDGCTGADTTATFTSQGTLKRLVIDTCKDCGVRKPVTKMLKRCNDCFAAGKTRKRTEARQETASREEHEERPTMSAAHALLEVEKIYSAFQQLQQSSSDPQGTPVANMVRAGRERGRIAAELWRKEGRDDKAQEVEKLWNGVAAVRYCVRCKYRREHDAEAPFCQQCTVAVRDGEPAKMCTKCGKLQCHPAGGEFCHECLRAAWKHSDPKYKAVRDKLIAGKTLTKEERTVLRNAGSDAPAPEEEPAPAENMTHVKQGAWAGTLIPTDVPVAPEIQDSINQRRHDAVQPTMARSDMVRAEDCVTCIAVRRQSQDPNIRCGACQNNKVTIRGGMKGRVVVSGNKTNKSDDDSCAAAELPSASHVAMLGALAAASSSSTAQSIDVTNAYMHVPMMSTEKLILEPPVCKECSGWMEEDGLYWHYPTCSKFRRT